MLYGCTHVVTMGVKELKAEVDKHCYCSFTLYTLQQDQRQMNVELPAETTSANELC